MNLWEIHPAFVHFPLAFLMGSTVLDIAARRMRRAHLVRVATWLLVAGLICVIPVASGGVLAYFTVPPHSQDANDRMLIHAFLAVTAALSYALVLVLRYKQKAEFATGSQIAASLVGAALLASAGALGGYLVYHDGVGVVAGRSALSTVKTGILSQAAV